MKTSLIAAVVLGLAGLWAGTTSAHEYGHHHGHPYHYPVVVARPPVVYQPPVVVRYPAYRPIVVPAPVYVPAPCGTFNYYGRGFGISLGF